MKREIASRGQKRVENLTIPERMISGACAGLCYWGGTFPLDAVKVSSLMIVCACVCVCVSVRACVRVCVLHARKRQFDLMNSDESCRLHGRLSATSSTTYYFDFFLLFSHHF